MVGGTVGVQRRKSKADFKMESPPPPDPIATLEVPDAVLYYNSRAADKTRRSKEDNIAVTNRGIKTLVDKEDIKTFAPESLLAQLNMKSQFYDHTAQSYTFSRSTLVFESVLDFYNTGILHLPKSLCVKACVEELEFWQISLEHLCPTCRNRYHECYAREKMEMALERELRPPPVVEEAFDRSCRYRLWRFVEIPSSSCPARFYAILIFASIICSVLLLCLETLPFLRFIPVQYQHKVNNTPEENLLDYLKFSQKNFYLDVTELVCAGLAFFDMMLRFCVSYDKGAYFRDPINLIDILYIFPSIAGVVLSRLHILAELSDVASVILRILMTLARTLRVLRLFWIARHYKPLKVMLMAIKKSMPDLMLMFVATLLMIGVFSILIYHAEASKSTFPDMLVAMWWSVVTMTTVGYGDFVPKTITGRLISTLCAFTGIMVIAMVIPIVANHFSVLHETSKHILEKLAMETRLKKAYKKVKEHGHRIKIKSKDMAEKIIVKANEAIPGRIKEGGGRMKDKSKDMAKKLISKNNEVVPEPMQDWYM